MKLRPILILVSSMLLLFAASIAAQQPDANQTLQDLRAQLNDLQNRQAELKIRLEQLNYDLKPENIERYFNGYGSTRPEELREARRKQLQLEKDRVVTQLDQCASDATRLETAISNAQARAYQQSALGSASLRPAEERGAHFITAARTVAAAAVLFVVLGSLGLRVAIRRRRNI